MRCGCSRCAKRLTRLIPGKFKSVSFLGIRKNQRIVGNEMWSLPDVEGSFFWDMSSGCQDLPMRLDA